MINFIVNILSVPPLRYPEKWKPAFLAMQLGFIAGGVGHWKGFSILFDHSKLGTFSSF